MSYIPQDDSLIAQLTVRETLKYTAQLRLSEATFSEADQVISRGPRGRLNGLLGVDFANFPLFIIRTIV